MGMAHITAWDDGPSGHPSTQQWYTCWVSLMLTCIGAITVGILASLGCGTSKGGPPVQTKATRLFGCQIQCYSFGPLGCQAQDHCSWHMLVLLGQERANGCGGLWPGPGPLEECHNGPQPSTQPLWTLLFEGPWLPDALPLVTGAPPPTTDKWPDVSDTAPKTIRSKDQVAWMGPWARDREWRNGQQDGNERKGFKDNTWMSRPCNSPPPVLVNLSPPSKLGPHQTQPAPR